MLSQQTLISPLRSLGVKSFGVVVGISSNSDEILGKLRVEVRRSLTEYFEVFENFDPNKAFRTITVNRSELGWAFFLDGELVAEADSESVLLKYFNSTLRIIVAEWADSHVFVHAGVVRIGDAIVVLPGDSHFGKTTLVSELIKLGAVYYSDEYAVIDEKGFVWPYARALSLRSADGKIEKDVEASELGAVNGSEPAPATHIVFTEFREGATWEAESLTRGKGILEIVKYTIPFNRNSGYCLDVLAKALENAVILKGLRGEADIFAKTLTSFCEV